MDNLTRRMLDDINLSKTVFPNLSTANKAANDLLKMNAFANTQGLLPHLNSLKIISGSILADQGLISDAIAAQKMLSSLTATKGLASNIGITQKLLSDFSAMAGLLPDFSFMQKVLSDFSAVKGVISGLTPSQIRMSLEVTSLAHLTLANLRWENIGEAINIGNKFRTHLHNNFLALSDSYFSLYHSLNQSDLRVIAVTPLGFELPAIELFNATDLLKVITTDDSEEEFIEEKQNARYEISIQVTDSLETLLAELDNNLVHLWQGAIQSLNSNNEDRARHFLISMRELFTHILHKLSSDDEIRAWSNSPEHFDKGRPTRRARLLYICRGINTDSFSAFIEKDITSVLSSWEILNHAHEIVIPYTQMQLNAFKIRTESALRLLLEIWKASK